MKWFCCSDIHSFYTYWLKSLKEAGFDYDNPEHGLLICGDIFDRGNKPLAVYEYLKNLPANRRILIRGNHETLLKDLYERGYPREHDESNGTNDTLCYLAHIIPERRNYMRVRELLRKNYQKSEGTSVNNVNINKLFERRRHKKFNNPKVDEILAWIASDEWVNFFESPHHIFVHSFIPLSTKKIIVRDEMLGSFVETTFNPNWRKATQSEWDEAMWGCPWRLYLNHIHGKSVLENKTLVCGHWHTSDFWNNLDFKYDIDKNMDIKDSVVYKSDKYPDLIGLDLCTVLSKKVGVLVLDSDTW